MGTSGVGLLTATNINAALPGATNPLRRQPFGPALGEIRELSDSAHSIYHGLQSKLEKRFSGGLYFLGVLHVVESDRQPEQRHGYRHRERPVSAGSATTPGSTADYPASTWLTRFVGSFVWELPFGRGKASGPVCRAP